MPATRPSLSFRILDGIPTTIAGGNGFQHHRTGDAACRTTWMMALGAGVRQGVVFDRSIAIHRSCAEPRRDHGILARPVARQADSGAVVILCCHAIFKAEHFVAYPPEARRLVRCHLDVLQTASAELPPKSAAGSNRLRLQVSRGTIGNREGTVRISIRFRRRSSSSGSRRSREYRSLATLEHFDWINLPAQFVEQEFGLPLEHASTRCVSQAATDYGAQLRSAVR